jgi:NAD+ diphosphatase
MKDAEAVTFAAARLDRAGHLREDAAAQAALWADPAGRCLAIWRGKPLFDTREGMRLGWLPTGDPVVAAEPSPSIFLGLEDGAPRFARDLAQWDGDGAPAA